MSHSSRPSPELYSAPSSRPSLFRWLWRFGPAGYILASAVMVLVRTAAFAVLVAPGYSVPRADAESLRLRFTPRSTKATKDAKVTKDAKIAQEPLRLVETLQPDGTSTLTVDPEQMRYLAAESQRIVVPKASDPRSVSGALERSGGAAPLLAHQKIEQHLFPAQ